jgi:hypothetical protein
MLSLFSQEFILFTKTILAFLFCFAPDLPNLFPVSFFFRSARQFFPALLCFCLLWMECSGGNAYRDAAALLYTFNILLPFEGKFFTFCGSFSHRSRHSSHKTPPKIKIFASLFPPEAAEPLCFRHNSIVLDKFWQALFPRFVSV